MKIIKVIVLGITLIQAHTLYANDEFACMAPEAAIGISCPNDLDSARNTASRIVSSLKELQYKCRKQNCPEASDIAQSIFLMEEAYKKLDIASDIHFTKSRCLTKDEQYIEKGWKKANACKRAVENDKKFRSILK